MHRMGFVLYCDPEVRKSSWHKPDWNGKMLRYFWILLSAGLIWTLWHRSMTIVPAQCDPQETEGQLKLYEIWRSVTFKPKFDARFCNTPVCGHGCRVWNFNNPFLSATGLCCRLWIPCCTEAEQWLYFISCKKNFCFSDRWVLPSFLYPDDQFIVIGFHKWL